MTIERETLDGCRRHDAASQAALYRRTWGLAMSVALRYAPSREDALEVCHDAYLNAFRALAGGPAGYDDARPFGPWFRRIVVRCAIDHGRSSRRYRATIDPRDAPPEAPVEPALGLEAADILRLLGALPGVQRAVFNLAEIDGYPHDEIAAMLGIAPATSRAHLSRARSTLRALYLAHNRVSP